MSKSRKIALLLVFVTVFIDLLGFGIVMPLLPRYGRHFEASGFQLGLLMASFSAMQFLFAPLWGKLSDRIGRRPVLIVGLAGSTISYALFGYATSLGRDGVLLGLSALAWLFISRIGAGIAGATISTAQAYIADVTGPTERARGMALIGAAFGIGFTFGPLIGAAFVSPAPVINITTEQLRMVEDRSDYSPEELTELVTQLRTLAEVSDVDEALLRSALTDPGVPLNPIPSAAPGYVASLLSAIALLFALFLLPESRTVAAEGQAGGRVGHHWLNFGQLRRLTASRPMLVILTGIFISTLALAQFESSLSLLTRHLGLGTRANFYVFAYIGFVLTLSQGVLVRRLVPRVGEYKMALSGACLMTIGLFVIGLAGEWKSPAALYAVLPVSIVGFSFVTPSLQSLLSRLASADEQGEVLGIGQSLSSLARILGPVIGLTLEARHLAAPYWSGAAYMLLGGLIFLLLKRVVPAPQDDSSASSEATENTQSP